GMDWDIRTREPYSSYEEFDFDVIVGKAEYGELGDCWNRYYVRIQEMRESLKIIRQAVTKIRGTEPGEENIRAKMKKVIKLPKGEVYSRTETARGELGFYLVGNGKDVPHRMKIRTPSFCSLMGFEEFTRDFMIADVVAVLGSIDIVLGDVDR
ncbi:NADH-quinone oxidoreductase subunit D, partial [Planctomycetota bacterium]